ncbi:MAG: PLP-dependent aminotransferase family protein [Burkholderiaceae bacterium]|jgi:GntR family transcriptional regulator/MocR family aminotransferase|nr:PLP-dependent aminotransferase family protein [Burkholderiaceae bacterium]
MQLPILIDASLPRSLQEQIVDQVRELILAGKLSSGTPLPASRSLARDLRISRNTVLGAYQRLGEEGFLETREQIGTFVAPGVHAEGPRQPLPEPDRSIEANHTLLHRRLQFQTHGHRVLSPDGPIAYDFWIGQVDPRLYPVRAWRSLLMRMLRTPSEQLCRYGDPQGLPELRAAIASYVGAARGIATDPSRILVTNGIQEGLSLLSRLLIRPGTEVVVEDPCYRGASSVFASHGAKLRPVPVDGDGIDPAALPADAALAYITPSHQYPLGSTLSLARRQALLEWSHACGAYLVEDDYDSDFYHDRAPLPALKSQDRNDHVVYLGTFSKSLGAGLRLGYMVLPEQLVEPARSAKALLNNCQPWLEQAALAEFINEGGFAHHLRRLRRACAVRCEHLRMAIAHHFPQAHITGTQSGMHLVATLPPDMPEAARLERAARRHGVGIYGVTSSNAQLFDPIHHHALRHSLLFGYAALSETEISEALLRVRRAATEIA